MTPEEDLARGEARKKRTWRYNETIFSFFRLYKKGVFKKSWALKGINVLRK